MPRGASGRIQVTIELVQCSGAPASGWPALKVNSRTELHRCGFRSLMLTSPNVELFGFVGRSRRKVLPVKSMSALCAELETNPPLIIQFFCSAMFSLRPQNPRIWATFAAAVAISKWRRLLDVLRYFKVIV